MAVTLTARRSRGDMFTAEDDIEVVFDYSDVGIMQEAFCTIEQISGVTVTHGGGAAAEAYLHYKAYDLHADADGYIDYTNQSVQCTQAEKGVSVIKIKVQYCTKTDYDAWQTSMTAFQATHETTEVLANGEVIVTRADDAPQEPQLTYDTLKTGEITLNWSDDTFV